MKTKIAKIPQEVIILAEKRQQARKNKNWQEADELRNAIKQKGYTVKDSKEGYEIIKN